MGAGVSSMSARPFRGSTDTCRYNTILKAKRICTPTCIVSVGNEKCAVALVVTFIVVAV